MGGEKENRKKVGFFSALSFVLIAIAILGVLPSQTISFRIGKQILAEAAITGLVIWWLLENRALKVLMLWLLVNVLTHYDKLSYIALNSLFVFTVFFALLTKEVYENRISTTAIFNLICIIALMQTTMGILERFKVPFLLASSCGTGFFCNSNVAGTALAMMLPAFFRRRWVFAAIPVAAAVFMSKSTTAYITLLAGVGALAFFHCRKKVIMSLIISGIIISGCAIMAMTGDLDNARFRIWRITFTEFVPKHPVSGFGLGHFKSVVPAVQKRVWHDREIFIHPHNEYARMAMETGIVGLVLMIIAIGSFLSMSFCFRDHIPFCGITASMVGACGIFIWSLSAGIITLLYMAVIQETKGKKQWRF